MLLGDKVSVLRKLEEHKGWEVLKSEAEQKIEEKNRNLVSIVMSEYPTNEREVGICIGFTQGIKWILSRPESLRKELENLISKQVNG